MTTCINGVCEIVFCFPKAYRYPFLSVLGLDKKLYCPLEGIANVSFAEATAAWRCGADIRIVNAFGYRDGITDLADFFGEMLRLRDNTKAEDPKGPLQKMYKDGANCPIGKFAQHNPVSREVAAYKLVGVVPEWKVEDLVVTDVNWLMHECNERGIVIEPSVGSLFFPFWNAITTGWERAFMGEWLQCFDLVLYYHTDSMIGIGYDARKGDALLQRYRLKVKPLHMEMPERNATIIRRALGGIDRDYAVSNLPKKNQNLINECFTRFQSGDENFTVDFDQEISAKLYSGARKGVSYGTRFKTKKVFDSRWFPFRKLVGSWPQYDTRPWHSIEEIPSES